MALAQRIDEEVDDGMSTIFEYFATSQYAALKAKVDRAQVRSIVSSVRYALAALGKRLEWVLKSNDSISVDVAIRARALFKELRAKLWPPDTIISLDHGGVGFGFSLSGRYLDVEIAPDGTHITAYNRSGEVTVDSYAAENSLPPTIHSIQHYLGL